MELEQEFTVGLDQLRHLHESFELRRIEAFEIFKRFHSSDIKHVLKVMDILTDCFIQVKRNNLDERPKDVPEFYHETFTVKVFTIDPLYPAFEHPFGQYFTNVLDNEMYLRAVGFLLSKRKSERYEIVEEFKETYLLSVITMFDDINLSEHLPLDDNAQVNDTYRSLGTPQVYTSPFSRYVRPSS